MIFGAAYVATHELSGMEGRRPPHAVPHSTRIYFAGDTYLAGFMDRIGRDFRPDVASINPREAEVVCAVQQLKP